MRRDAGFTLIELLIVVAIIAILAAIAVPNFLEAQERALRASDAARLKTLGMALQTYLLDYNKLPPADQEAGPFESHTPEYALSIQNGPAGGGSWDGVPWLLLRLRYVTSENDLFCPRYLRLYKSGKTMRGNWPRYHNFRYAYNTNALGTVFNVGRGGNPSADGKGRVWLVRDLHIAAKDGWWSSKAPKYPADYQYPWGADRDVEYCLYSDLSVQLVQGGTDTPPKDLK